MGKTTIYIVGTTHGSPKSKSKVKKIINEYKPDAVFSEGVRDIVFLEGVRDIQISSYANIIDRILMLIDRFLLFVLL